MIFCNKDFLGKKFKEYRKKAKLTQDEISEKIGIAEKHYGKLERGIFVPGLETFFKLVEALNIPLSEFGLNINAAGITNVNRDKLIKEVYTLNNSELELIIDIIDTIKKYNKKL